MLDTQRNRIASFHRILDFTDENPLVPAKPLATALVTELNTTAGALDILAGNRDLAFGTVTGAAADRQVLKKSLTEFLKDLAQTARVLDPVTYPGLAAEMRLGRATSSYAALIVRARAFHVALVPAKDAFVDYGSPETVDADLLALITAFEAATERKNGGKAIHIGGTAGLYALCKTGVAIVQKLDAILSKVYKNDPVLYAAWKAARRVQRTPSPAAPEPDNGSGDGSAPEPGN